MIACYGTSRGFLGITSHTPEYLGLPAIEYTHGTRDYNKLQKNIKVTNI